MGGFTPIFGNIHFSGPVKKLQFFLPPACIPYPLGGSKDFVLKYQKLNLWRSMGSRAVGNINLSITWILWHGICIYIYLLDICIPYTYTLPLIHMKALTLSLTAVARHPVSNKNRVADDLSRTFTRKNKIQSLCLWFLASSNAWTHHILGKFLERKTSSKQRYTKVLIQIGSTNHTWNWGKGDMEDHYLTSPRKRQKQNQLKSSSIYESVLMATTLFGGPIDLQLRTSWWFSSRLKNESNPSSPQVGVNIKNAWNNHLL